MFPLFKRRVGVLGDILFAQTNENVLPKTNIHKEGLYTTFNEMLLS
jgi:hypothetical protein